MERVRHARIPVHLNAVLIGEKTVPKGCKVRNVSNQGMLLQCDADGRILTFRDGDHVDIHLLFQRPDGTKYLTISAIVRHVAANGIGVEFRQPDTEVVNLLESCRVDEVEGLEATISHHQKQAADAGRPNAVAAAVPGSDIAADAGQGQPPVAVKSHRLYQMGLISVAAALGIITIGYLRTSDMGARVVALETLTRSQNSELALIQSRLSGAGDTDNDSAYRNIPGQSTDAGTVPESEPEHTAGTPLQQNLPAVVLTADEAGTSGTVETGGAIASEITHEGNAAGPAIADPARMTSQDDTSVPAAIPGAGKRGPWVINLLSSPSKADADRLAVRARTNDIPVEQSRVKVKDRDFWRLQVTGFMTSGQAEDYAISVKAKLGVRDVWIFKP